jgi:hypothetical protein
MPFSLRQFDADDKFCQAINLDVFNELYPPETVIQVLTECHAKEQRARKLTLQLTSYSALQTWMVTGTVYDGAEEFAEAIDFPSGDQARLRIGEAFLVKV